MQRVLHLLSNQERPHICEKRMCVLGEKQSGKFPFLWILFRRDRIWLSECFGLGQYQIDGPVNCWVWTYVEKCESNWMQHKHSRCVIVHVMVHADAFVKGFFEALIKSTESCLFGTVCQKFENMYLCKFLTWKIDCRRNNCTMYTRFTCILNLGSIDDIHSNFLMDFFFFINIIFLFWKRWAYFLVQNFLLLWSSIVSHFLCRIHIHILPTSYVGLILRSTAVATACWRVLWYYCVQSYCTCSSCRVPL